MQFGLFMTMPSPHAAPAAEIYARGIDIAQLGEELGFSNLWLAEHHFTNYSYSSRPLVLLSHIAARTRRIRLGPAIIPVPLHHPLTVAEELATIDVLSGGRLEVGLGKGYAQYQYDRFGLVKTEDSNRYSEGIDVIKAALSSNLFSYTGNTYKIPQTKLYPQPLQTKIPFWLVTNTTVRESIEDAVRRQMNIFTGVFEPISKLVNIRRTYPDLFTDNDLKIRIGTQRPVYVAETEEEAKTIAEEARWNARVSVRMRQDIASVESGVIAATPFPQEPTTAKMMDDFLVIGTPERCIHQLTRIKNDLGADYFSCSFWFGGLDHKKVLRSMERFAQYVAPAFA